VERRLSQVSVTLGIKWHELIHQTVGVKVQRVAHLIGVMREGLVKKEEAQSVALAVCCTPRQRIRIDEKTLFRLMDETFKIRQL
jgi:hypothetical protein